MADIRETHRPEKCVADGVHEHIRVRMTCQPFWVRDLDTSEDQLSAFDQWVNIITDSNVYHRPRLMMAYAFGEPVLTWG